MFCLEPALRTTAREAVSQIALRDRSKEVREEPGDRGVFAGGRQVEGGGRTHSQTAKEDC